MGAGIRASGSVGAWLPGKSLTRTAGPTGWSDKTSVGRTVA